MANYTSKYTGEQIDLSVASGSSTTGITSGSSTSTASFGHINVGGTHIHSNGTKRLTLGATNIFAGSISASGQFQASSITASGVGGILSGKDIELRHGVIGGDTLVKIYRYAGNDDGIVDVYQNNVVKSRIHGNGLSFISGGNTSFGTDVDSGKTLTVKGDISASGDLYLQGLDIYGGTTKRLTLGATNTFVGILSASKLEIGGPQNSITSSGRILTFDDIELRDGAVGGDTLVKIYDSADDGIIDVYQNNVVKSRIHGNGLSFISGGNTAFGTDADSGKTLTVKGDISASGDLYLRGDDIYNDGIKRLTFGATNHFVGNLTASGQFEAQSITASGASKGILSYNDIELRDGAIGGDTLVKIYDSSDDGIIDIYNDNKVKIRLDGATGNISASGTDHIFGGNIRAIGDVIAERYIVSSSVTHLTQSFSSGSTIFGDTMDDTHQFTGSMKITGSLNVTETVTAEGLLISDDATITDDLYVGGNISGSSTSTGSFSQIKIPRNSSAVNPTINFGDGDTGIFEGSDDTLSIAMAGAAKWEFSGTHLTSGNTRGNKLMRVTGTATAPVYAINGDTDTGIGSSAANNLSLITGGVETLRLVGNTISGSSISTGSFGHGYVDGKLGVNAKAPIQDLHVAGTVGVANYIYHNGDLDTYLRLEDDKITLSTGGSTAVIQEGHITASGDISGSSTSTGSFGRVEAEHLESSDNIVAGNRITADYGTITYSLVVNESGHGGGDFRVESDNNQYMIWSDAGTDKIAIGTVTPTSVLTVNGDLTTTHITASGNISSSGTGSFTSGIVTGPLTGVGLLLGTGSAPNVGLGRNTSEWLNLIAGGSTRWSIKNTGDIESATGGFAPLLKQGSGTQTNPVYSFAGDSNTGMSSFSPGDGLALIAGGKTGLVISESGNVTRVAIGGKLNPSEQVHISGSGDTKLFVEGDISGSSTSTGSFGRTSTTTLDLTSIEGNWTNAGNTVADLGTITTIDINGGTINGITDLAVADGGTGAGTFTDGGVLLGSGTAAITAMGVLTDGQMIVGDGSTDPVAESGATLRTSIGVGTTDNVHFNHITASGNISASGDIINTGAITSINGTGSFAHINSIGDISASGGIIYAQSLQVGGSTGMNKINLATANRIDINPDGVTAVRLTSTTVTLNKNADVNGYLQVDNTITASKHITGSVSSTASFGRFDAPDGFYDSGTKLSDYVFEPEYVLRTIPEVENFVKDNKHLPGVPGMDKIEQWQAMSIGDRQTLFLEKIEELTLYVIDLQNQVDELKNKQ